jgi:hypothetical protein
MRMGHSKVKRVEEAAIVGRTTSHQIAMHGGGNPRFLQLHAINRRNYAA